MAMIHAKLDEIKKDAVLINDLPDDCLSYISSFLPIPDKLNIERVCKKWRELSEKGWIYTSEINLPGEFSKNQLDVIFKRCGRFLRKLCIEIRPFCINYLPLIMEFCQLNRLKDIHLTLHKTSEVECTKYCKNLTELFEKSRALKSVRLEGDLADYDIEYSNILTSLDLRKLEISPNAEWFNFLITLDDFPNLIEVIFEGIFIEVVDEKTYENLRGLESIVIHRCYTPTELFKNLQFFTNLKILDIRYGSPEFMEKEDFQGIIKNCRNLMKLYLFDGEWLGSFFQDLGRIATLKTICYYRLPTTSDGMNIKYLTNLEELEIYGYDDEIDCDDELLHLIIHSVKLKKVNLGVRRVLGNLRARITNIFVQGLRKIPLNLTFLIFRYSEDSIYDGPEHPLFKVNVHDERNAPQ